MMDRIKIERINELSRKARTGPLTDEERSEREKLRKEYVESCKSSLRQGLDRLAGKS